MDAGAYARSVDWLLFVGLMLAGLMIAVAIVVRMRLEAFPRRMPSWLPLVGVVAAALLLVVALLASSWLNAVNAVLLMVTFSMLFVGSRRSAAA